MDQSRNYVQMDNNGSPVMFPEIKYRTEGQLEDELKRKFSSGKFLFKTFISGIFVMILSVFNTYTVYRNFLRRPGFNFFANTTKENNPMQSLVYYIEFFTLNILIVTVLFSFFMIPFAFRDNMNGHQQFQKKLVSGYLLTMFEFLFYFLQFNLFYMIPLCSTDGLLGWFNLIRTITKAGRCANNPAETVAGYILGTGLYLMLILIIISTFVLKLSEVSFIGEKTLAHWSLREWSLILALLNNVASIGTSKHTNLNFLWRVLRTRRKVKESLYTRAWIYTKIYNAGNIISIFHVLSLNADALFKLVRVNPELSTSETVPETKGIESIQY